MTIIIIILFRITARAALVLSPFVEKNDFILFVQNLGYYYEYYTWGGMSKHVPVHVSQICVVLESNRSKSKFVSSASKGVLFFQYCKITWNTSRNFVTCVHHSQVGGNNFITFLHKTAIDKNKNLSCLFGTKWMLCIT